MLHDRYCVESNSLKYFSVFAGRPSICRIWICIDERFTLHGVNFDAIYNMGFVYVGFDPGCKSLH